MVVVVGDTSARLRSSGSVFLSGRTPGHDPKAAPGAQSAMPADWPGNGTNSEPVTVG
jgi:hypothetical protein